MTTDWTETPDGFRQWTQGCGAKWRTRQGMIEAFDINGAPIVTTSADMSERTRRAARWLPGLLDAGATTAEARALLAIAAVESAGRDLPAFGDYRTADNPKVSVPASTPGARPLSVGIYQFKESTAADAGATWNELATSEAANHRAALKHLRWLAPRHGGDFLTLAANWNAGSVRRSPKNDVWCVVSYSPTLLTKYAAAWNAAGAYVPELRPKEPVSPTKLAPPMVSDPRFTPVIEPQKAGAWVAVLGFGAVALLIAARGTA